MVSYVFKYDAIITNNANLFGKLWYETGISQHKYKNGHDIENISYKYVFSYYEWNQSLTYFFFDQNQSPTFIAQIQTYILQHNMLRL